MGSSPGYEPRRSEGGHPGATVGIVLLTLVVTALLGGCAALVGMDWGGLGCAMGGGCPPGLGDDHGSRAGTVLLGVLAGVCFLGGLVWAFRVGTGPRTAEWKPARELLSEPLRTWRVAERAVNLVDSPGSSGVVACLARRARVVEVARRGDYLQVVTSDGRAGWVRRCEVSRGGRRGS